MNSEEKDKDFKDIPTDEIFNEITDMEMAVDMVDDFDGRTSRLAAKLLSLFSMIEEIWLNKKGEPDPSEVTTLAVVERGVEAIKSELLEIGNQT